MANGHRIERADPAKALGIRLEYFSHTAIQEFLKITFKSFMPVERVAEEVKKVYVQQLSLDPMLVASREAYDEEAGIYKCGNLWRVRSIQPISIGVLVYPVERTAEGLLVGGDHKEIYLESRDGKINLENGLS
jgi:hypothetical protein